MLSILENTDIIGLKIPLSAIINIQIEYSPSNNQAIEFL